MNSAAPSTVSASVVKPTEVIKYVLMPPQKIRTFAAEANFPGESFIKEIRATWKVDIFNDAEKMEMVNDSVLSQIRMHLRLCTPTIDHEELLQAISRIFGEQKVFPDLEAEFYAV